MEKILQEIKKDLDAGQFYAICSNETTFLEYLEKKLKELKDK